ncbi:hypothetical protein [Bartonella raoultii]|uniref:Phage related protein n=1 Tax=Bartonella raoultii TaxID=1457020 RepID=A0ABS7I5W5_9HYPH|nr:hypothetical protein [Bartonella raoultii]MBX4335800.1 hypothetical protein [Bartonella raoultii]
MTNISKNTPVISNISNKTASNNKQEPAKKYEFTNETRCVAGHTLHRIKAIRDFGDVKAGSLGGFIEKESNLSHDGNCWVANEARVYNNALVSDNALVFSYAFVYKHARVFNNAAVCDKAVIRDNAKVYGNALLIGIHVLKIMKRLILHLKFLMTLVSLYL